MKLKNIKIATVLPYKENYTFNKASAASLWVYEFFKTSKHKEFNYIYGSTNNKDFLSKNYINIYLKSLDSKFKSSTSEYCDKLEIEIKKKTFDIVEIHNRPLIFFKLIKTLNTKDNPLTS